jgi:phosphocarrier protein HPr
MSSLVPLSREVTVNTAHGLHLSPCARVAAISAKFQCKIDVINGATRVNGKSILDLMTLAAIKGTILRIEAEGEDATEALDALSDLFERELIGER